jgi:hypothetical protein
VTLPAGTSRAAVLHPLNQCIEVSHVEEHALQIPIPGAWQPDASECPPSVQVPDGIFRHRQVTGGAHDVEQSGCEWGHRSDLDYRGWRTLWSDPRTTRLPAEAGGGGGERLGLRHPTDPVNIPVPEKSCRSDALP